MVRYYNRSRNIEIVLILVCLAISSNLLSAIGTANQPPDVPSQPSGAEEAIVGESNNYTTITTDPDNDQVQYGWTWDNDNIVDEWTPNIPSGVEVSTPHIWTTRGISNIRVKARDNHAAESDFSNSLKVRIAILGDVNDDGTVNEDDIPAFVTALNGESYFYDKYPEGAWFAADINRDGYVDFYDIDPFNELLAYATNNQPEQPTVPDGPNEGEVNEELTYSTNTTDPDNNQVYYRWDWGDEISDWLGPYNSGVTVEADHQWDTLGTYKIKVQAKDIYDNESEWSLELEVTIIEQIPETPPLDINTDSTIIEGNVFNVIVTSNNNPVNNVEVTFNNIIISTNDEGEAEFTAPSVVITTDFTIIASKEGYQSDEFIITVLNQDEQEINRGWFFGTVYSDNLLPLPDVQILFTTGITSWSTYTDNQGSYIIQIPANIYTIKVSLEGYESIIESDKTLTPNTAIEQNFILNKIPDYEPIPSDDINTQLMEEKIHTEIKNNKVGGKIEIEEDYSVIVYNDELTIEIESVTTDEEIVTFTVGAYESTPSQVIVLLIKDLLDEISIDFDGEQISETTNLYTFFSPENQENEYAIVTTVNTSYVLIHISSFSEHTITITSVVVTINIISSIIFYIIICVIVGILFSSLKVIRIIRRIYFQKK